ncbi:MAG: YceI family protein [Bacteroidales bacterium]|nr:YceI family protein [Bacteroidales bacterium]
MKTKVSTKWVVDRAHSEVLFKAKHLVISTVTGQFNEFDAGLEMEEDSMDNANAWFTASVNSVSTNNTDRDNHLKSADFFNAESFPEIRFESVEFVNDGENRYRMTGNLTMRGITKRITLDVEFGGTMADPYGNIKAGYEITGKLNRHDFGLKWNAVTEAGGLVVGDEIKLALNIQMVRSQG